MKRILIITLSILCVVGLALRAIWKYSDDSAAERERFLTHLGYHFKARIDSVAGFPDRPDLFMIYFNNASGHFDNHVEQRLNAHLRHREMHFISSAGETHWIYVHQVKILAGDSLFVNAARDSVSIIRDRKTIMRTSVSHSSYGKPWR